VIQTGCQDKVKVTYRVQNGSQDKDTDWEQTSHQDRGTDRYRLEVQTGYHLAVQTGVQKGYNIQTGGIVWVQTGCQDRGTDWSTDSGKDYGVQAVRSSHHCQVECAF